MTGLDQAETARILVQEMRADGTEMVDLDALTLLDYLARLGISFTVSREACDAYDAKLRAEIMAAEPTAGS